MDELEKFMQDNRENFDHKAPNSLKIWNKLNDQLGETKSAKKRSYPWGFLKIAASVLVIFSFAGFLFFGSNSSKTNDSYAENQELNDVNNYYTKLIDYKITELNSSDLLSDLDKQEFLEYFEELDQECMTLENELKLQVDNEEILIAIIENYRQRLNLLENLLSRLDKSKIQNNEKSILL